MRDYQSFIVSKSQSGRMAGFQPTFLPECLFDFQAHLADWAIRKGRAAIFADCGLGKSLMQLVWAENVVRHTNKPVLLATPIAVGLQMLREADKFGIAAKRTRGGHMTDGKCVWITNYEQLHKYDPKRFAGFAGDESGCIKDMKSERKATVVEFTREMPFRLLCTATAAPNDFFELGNSSEALGYLGFRDMITWFFKQETSKDHHGWGRTKYRFRGHAEQPFWSWVCSWARSIRKPSDLGFSDERFILPKLIEREIVVETAKARAGQLFAVPARDMREERAERRHSLKERCERAAQLAIDHQGPSSVWCELNPEGDLLAKLIPDSIQVSGAMSDDAKEEALTAFSLGQVKRIVLKPKIGAWGLNWQHCANAVVLPSHCYDETTEILTKRGWLTFGNVESADDVATVNPDTLAFEWQNPTDVIWSPYEGSMIHFGEQSGSKKNFDLLVTPNHRMFVKRCPIRYRTDGKWMIKTAGDLVDNFKRQEYRMLSVPRSFVGAEMESIPIPPYERKPARSSLQINKAGDRRGLSAENWKGLDLGRLKKVKSIPIKSFIQLAGWYLTEGSCGCRNGELDGQVTITQTEVNPENRKEIISLLTSIPGLHVYTETNDIRFCSKQIAVMLDRQFGSGSYNKKIPTWIKELSTEYLTLLRDTMLKGDGCSHVRGGQKWFYRTVSKRLADDFAEICLKTGVRGSVHPRVVKDGPYAGNILWDVNIARQNIEPSIHIKPVVEHYRGMIGCVTVPNGLVIVRRNGIPVVSGNSYEQYYQLVRRHYRFGQTRDVTVSLIISEGEIGIGKSLRRKQDQTNRMFSSLVKHMNDAMSLASDDVFPLETKVPSWL